RGDDQARLLVEAGRPGRRTGEEARDEAAGGLEGRAVRQPRRLTLRYFASTSAPVTVSTTFTALPPTSFDEPLARAAMFTGTSSSRRPASTMRMSASTSGASLENSFAR